MRELPRLSFGHKESLVAFRLVIFLALSFLLLYSPREDAAPTAAPLLLALLYLLSDLALLAVPRRRLEGPWVHGAILLADLAVITWAIFLSTGFRSELYLVYFLVIFMSGIQTRAWHSFLTGTVACALYAWLWTREPGAAGESFLSPPVLLRLPFFYMVAFFSAIFSEKARSDQEAFEGRLEVARRRVAVGRLAGKIASEMNAPLSVILGFSRSLLGRMSPSDPLHMPVESISREARRCCRLLERFLLLRGECPPLLDTTSVDDAVSDALDALFRGGGLPEEVRVLREPAPGLPSVRAARTELAEALGFLLRNAVEAMPGGGTLTVRCRRESVRGRERVCVDVLDTGGGVSDRARARLFEPFFSTKRNAEGLGLCFASAIAHRHRGDIRFESVPGGGTRFTLALPPADARGGGPS